MNTEQMAKALREGLYKVIAKAVEGKVITAELAEEITEEIKKEVTRFISVHQLGFTDRLEFKFTPAPEGVLHGELKGTLELVPVMPAIEVPRLLSREEAAQYLGYTVDRLRNYEVESALFDLTGNVHFVNEFCPFNGIFCMAIYFVSKEVLEETKRRIKTNDPRTINIDFYVREIDKELTRRTHKQKYDCFGEQHVKPCKLANVSCGIFYACGEETLRILSFEEEIAERRKARQND